MTRIENWTVCKWSGEHCLLGKIIGHPNPLVGRKDLSITSPIIDYDFLNTVTTKSGTQYQLGDPNPDGDGLKMLEEMFL